MGKKGPKNAHFGGHKCSNWPKISHRHVFWWNLVICKICWHNLYFWPFFGHFSVKITICPVNNGSLNVKNLGHKWLLIRCKWHFFIEFKYSYQIHWKIGQKSRKKILARECPVNNVFGVPSITLHLSWLKAEKAKSYKIFWIL